MFYKHITFHLAMAQGLLSRMISNIGILISLALLHNVGIGECSIFSPTFISFEKTTSC